MSVTSTVKTQAPMNGHGNGSAFPLPKAKLGLWVFLAVVTIMFSALVSAYIVRMGLSDWKSLTEPLALWFNTAALLLSSISFLWAQASMRQPESKNVRWGLLAAGGFGLWFVIGQLLAWQQLGAMGYFVATNPANTFFYLITALHGLHMLGGLIAWGITTAKAWQGILSNKVRLNVELCAVYWHFLLLVWLVLFGLMLLT